LDRVGAFFFEREREGEVKTGWMGEGVCIASLSRAPPVSPSHAGSDRVGASQLNQSVRERHIQWNGGCAFQGGGWKREVENVARPGEKVSSDSVIPSAGGKSHMPGSVFADATSKSWWTQMKPTNQPTQDKMKKTHGHTHHGVHSMDH